MEVIVVSDCVFHVRKVNDNWTCYIFNHGHTHGFLITGEKPLSMEECQEIQARIGYDPRGYGCFGFQVETANGHMFRARWNCFNNCD